MKTLIVITIALFAVLSLVAIQPVATASPPQSVIKANTTQLNDQTTSCSAILPAPTLLTYSPPNMVENQQEFRYIDITCKAPALSNSPPMGAADNSYFVLSNPPAPAQSAIYYNEMTNLPALPGNNYEDSKSNDLVTTGFNNTQIDIYLGHHLKTTTTGNMMITNPLC